MNYDAMRANPGYYYLGTPYSKYPYGLEMAYVEACRAAGRLIEFGIRVFSPIAHTHPIARLSNIDPLDYSIWIPADQVGGLRANLMSLHVGHSMK